MCLFEIQMTDKNLIIGCIYRPPNSNLPSFNEEIGNIINKLNHHNENMYLLGDYNVDLLL